MIDYLRGTLALTTPTAAVIDVNGVGYQVGMSVKSLANLPEKGREVQVFTVMAVSESAIALYGFATVEEREMYTRLVGVKGVGPKAALAILSVLDPSGLAEAVQAGDDKRIAAAQGIGKKTAQRIILELKGSLDTVPTLLGEEVSGGAVPSAVAEATAALFSMGFSSAEVEVALKGYDGAPSDVTAAIKHALGRLGS